MYQAQPYAYPQPMYAIPTYPPPLIPNGKFRSFIVCQTIKHKTIVTPIEPVSPPHDETTNTQSPHETTSDKSDYVEHVSSSPKYSRVTLQRTFLPWFSEKIRHSGTFILKFFWLKLHGKVKFSWLLLNKFKKIASKLGFVKINKT